MGVGILLLVYSPTFTVADFFDVDYGYKKWAKQAKPRRTSNRQYFVQAQHLHYIAEQNMEESNAELESFRQKWREEVSARSKAEGKKASNVGSSSSSRRPQPAPRDRFVKQSEDDDEVIRTQASRGSNGGSRAPGIGFGESSTSSSGSKEPQSAIEHYEKAVEKESQGSLGDSLNHYRKAFRVS